MIECEVLEAATALAEVAPRGVQGEGGQSFGQVNATDSRFVEAQFAKRRPQQVFATANEFVRKVDEHK